MTPHGILVALAAIVGLIAFVIRLTIKGRLYVGYSVIWLVWLAGGGLLLLSSRALSYVTVAVGAVYPVSAVTLLALMGIFLVLIYFSCQLTVLAARVTAIAQHIALAEVQSDRKL